MLAWVALAVTPLSGCFEPANNAWAAEATQIDRLRDDGLTGRSIRVAILDTGIDLDHPSLRHLTDRDAINGELIGYADFLGQSGGPRDRAGHGTFVAGVLAAQPPDGLASVTASESGVRGLAPEVDLLVGRVCETDHCDLGAVWQGIAWAIAQDVDIISLSLGYTQSALDGEDYLAGRLRQSLREADVKGILVVAAAGNEPGGVLFPAREASVLAVAAMDRDGQPRGSSARGYGSDKPDLVAPGQGIVGPAKGTGRVSKDGTSAAVPFVVAAAALMMAGVEDPDTVPEVAALRQALRDTAQPLPGQKTPQDPWAGRGLVQAESAATRYALALRELDPDDR